METGYTEAVERLLAAKADADAKDKVRVLLPPPLPSDDPASTYLGGCAGAREFVRVCRCVGRSKGGKERSGEGLASPQVKVVVVCTVQREGQASIRGPLKPK